jgi:predicted acylesterase/phospholipase RssA
MLFSKRLIAPAEDQAAAAQIPDMGRVRYRVDFDLAAMEEDGRAALLREMDVWRKGGHAGPLPTAHYLAISGGGAKGAFAAGLLNGWTATGNRPEFKIVTGVSTGALIAPFAFLGSEYDAALKEVYTTVTTKDIYIRRGLLAALFGDAIRDNRPLCNLVERHMDEAFIDKVAREYDRGRMLLICTVNLDRKKPVIWNMGAIAQGKRPQALALFRRIIIASSAIPSVFPPVMFEVDVNGKRYQEMHVDGCTAAEVFLYPPGMRVREASERLGVSRQRELHIIWCDRLDSEKANVDRRTLSISQAALKTALHYAAIGDLLMLYFIAQNDDIDYNLSYIDQDFQTTHKADFDPRYMQPLFEYGFRRATQGSAWKKTPPRYPRPDLELGISP